MSKRRKYGNKEEEGRRRGHWWTIWRRSSDWECPNRDRDVRTPMVEMWWNGFERTMEQNSKRCAVASTLSWRWQETQTSCWPLQLLQVIKYVITSCVFAQCNIAISRRSSNLIYPYYPVCSNVAAFRIISKGSVRFTRAAEWKTCVTRPEPSSTEPRSEATGPGKTCATAMLSRWPAIRCTSTKDRPKFRCDKSPGTAWAEKHSKTEQSHMIFWLLSKSNITNSDIQNMSKW